MRIAGLIQKSVSLSPPESKPQEAIFDYNFPDSDSDKRKAGSSGS